MAAAVVAAGIGLFWSFAIERAASTSWEELGQRGDFWGGHLNAVMSLTTALLFVAALLLQSNELALQRTELIEAREVYSAQEAQLRAQAEAARRQVEIAEEQATLSGIFQMAQILTALKTTHATATGALGGNPSKGYPVQVAGDVGRCEQALGSLIDSLAEPRASFLREALIGKPWVRE